MRRPLVGFFFIISERWSEYVDALESVEKKGSMRQFTVKRKKKEKKGARLPCDFTDVCKHASATCDCDVG